MGVLAHEQRDPQLALLVARLLEDGPGPGPHTQRLVDQVRGAAAHPDVKYLWGVPIVFAGSTVSL